MDVISKVVLPAAGLGTRLLPITKELPKEMLPIFVKGRNDEQCLKPVLQAVFEQLYEVGLRDFCFIVGREKRAIEDHFTPDTAYLEMLESRRKSNHFKDVKEFYNMLSASNLIWVNQPEPKGFGNSVLMAESFVGDSSFLVHAGDTYVDSGHNEHIKMLMKLFQEKNPDAVFLAQRVKDPKNYGIIEGVHVARRLYKVKKVEEKPQKPKSNLGIIPLYVFGPSIFKFLREIDLGVNKEYQLTDAVQLMIDSGAAVYALELSPRYYRLDIGTPENYLRALNLSHKYLKRSR